MKLRKSLLTSSDKLNFIVRTDSGILFNGNHQNISSNEAKKIFSSEKNQLLDYTDKLSDMTWSVSRQF